MAGYLAENSAIPYWLNLGSSNYLIFIYFGWFIAAYLSKEWLIRVGFLIFNIVLALDMTKAPSTIFDGAILLTFSSVIIIKLIKEGFDD
jgi:hypothetical protein